MLSFDPSDARVERAANKQRVEIMIGSYKQRDDIEYEEVEEGVWVEVSVPLVPSYVTTFWFIERGNAQIQSDVMREDGIYAKYISA